MGSFTQRVLDSNDVILLLALGHGDDCELWRECGV